jgi:hypothetical protein
MEIKQRSYEIVKIFKKLNQLNLGINGFKELDEFREICNRFIKNGEFVSGNINIYGTKRIICYSFNDKVECILKYDATI